MTCEKFATKWSLKFNAKKSVGLQSVSSIYNDHCLCLRLNDTFLKIVKDEFAGKINENSNKVRKSFFSLNNFDMKPNELSPMTQ